ncbi:MAG: alpha/beta fold hydrolase, partial [Pseudomonadota bacterium]
MTKDRSPEGRLIKTKFGSLHLIERGEKEEAAGSGNRGIRPLVMIHGSTTNALDMDIELVGRLEEGRSLFLPDRPGHGFSDRPKDGWRLDVQAAAIREALIEAGVEDPIILGQSYGGAIALRYALDYGNEISGLVLVAPVTHRWPGGVAWYNRIAINPLYGWLFRRSFIALYSRYGAKRGALRALRGAAFASRYFDRTRVAMTFRPSKFYNNAEDIVRLYEQ